MTQPYYANQLDKIILSKGLFDRDNTLVAKLKAYRDTAYG